MVGRTATASDVAAFERWSVSSGLSPFQMPWEIMKIALSTELALAPEGRIAWARLAATYEAVSALDALTPPGRVMTLDEAVLLRTAILAIDANTPQELQQFNDDLSIFVSLINPLWSMQQTGSENIWSVDAPTAIDPAMVLDLAVDLKTVGHPTIQEETVALLG